MTVRVLELGPGGLVPGTLADASVQRLASSPVGGMWIDLEAPSREELASVVGALGLPPGLAPELGRRPLRARVDRRGHWIVFGAMTVEPHRTPPMREQEIQVVVGPRVLLTVHPERSALVEEVTERLAAEGGNPGGTTTTGFLLYQVLDQLLDWYFPALDRANEVVEQVEAAVFDHAGRRTLRRIFQLRTSLLRLRRSVGSLRDGLNLLLLHADNWFGAESFASYQELYDRTLRLMDVIDTMHDVLTGILEAYLSVASNQLNQTMRTLTAWSIILMSLSLIAGIYGMNFRTMPGLGSPWGFPLALGGMGLLGFGLFLLFRHIRWL